jgi:hypothetical protein
MIRGGEDEWGDLSFPASVAAPKRLGDDCKETLISNAPLNLHSSATTLKLITASTTAMDLLKQYSEREIHGFE